MKCPVLKVVFNAPISSREITAFRGSIIAKVGIAHELFHNHDNDETNNRRYHYRYPLIQYRQDAGKPAMVFIGKAVAEAYRLFSQPDWTLQFGHRSARPMHILQLHVDEHLFGISEEPYYYTLRNWLALNEKNVEQYMQTEDLKARISQLENILAGNIISFSKGVEYRLETRFELCLTQLNNIRPVHFENIRMMAFDVSFKANIILPPHIALGKGVSVGFGEIIQASKPALLPRNKYIETSF